MVEGLWNRMWNPGERGAQEAPQGGCGEVLLVILPLLVISLVALLALVTLLLIVILLVLVISLVILLVLCTMQRGGDKERGGRRKRSQHRGTSFVRKRLHLGPYSRGTSRRVWCTRPSSSGARQLTPRSRTRPARRFECKA